MKQMMHRLLWQATRHLLAQILVIEEVAIKSG
jgi:hypothetical protein